MDGDVNLVVMLVDDADDLLIGCLLPIGRRERQPDQSAKLTDTIVDMHKVISDFHFL